MIEISLIKCKCKSILNIVQNDVNTNTKKIKTMKQRGKVAWDWTREPSDTDPPGTGTGASHIVIA